MSKIPSLLDLLKAGAHFGHQKSKRYPKMEPYIYTQRDNVDVFDLEKTQEKLKSALEFITKVVEKGGTVLFVGTKRQAKAIVKKYADEASSPYVIERWVGGTFTNFSNIIKLIKKLKEFEENKAKGELQKYTKKEQLDFEREIERLNTLIGGIKNITKTPEAIFVIDLKNEKTALREAKKMKIPIIALTDSNVNPKGVDYIIPGNDDAIKTIDLITSLIAQAVKEGRKK